MDLFCLFIFIINYLALLKHNLRNATILAAIIGNNKRKKEKKGEEEKKLGAKAINILA